MQRKLVPDVVSVQEIVELPAEATVREAARAMKFQNVGSVLITDQGRLEGIFTLQDLVYRVVAPGRDLDTTTLGQVMTADPDTIAADATALQALMSMQDGGYRHLPVTDGARVVAVVSRRDFFGSEKAQLEDQTYLWERI
jgi:CBS domain-containing protein